MNRKNGEAIANLIGKLDPSGMKVYDTATFKDYLRLRVIIDITKPLKKGFFLKQRDKEDLWIKFKYERLSDFCYVCRLIGHGLNDCMEKSGGDRSKIEYGSYLRAEISIIEPSTLENLLRPSQILSLRTLLQWILLCSRRRVC